MKKVEVLEYEWPDTGRLEILMNGNRSVRLRFTPKELIRTKKSARGRREAGRRFKFAWLHLYPRAGKTFPTSGKLISRLFQAFQSQKKKI